MSESNDMAGRGLSRRKFIADVARTACGVGLIGTGLLIYARQASSLPAAAIRPPGALAEEAFLGACIRCGMCVRDCPFDILFLAQLGEEVATGTPYFHARSGPCEMCTDIPCVKACPTNALDHGLKDINNARMGLAVLVDQETCVAFLGLRCEVCFNVCPIRGSAITLEYQHNARSGKHARFIPVVHSDACTGCGLCERACILEEAAIRVFPHHLAKGELGGHYRIGWKEKEARGEALVAPDVERQYNLPEGVRYELQGEGLIFDDPGAGQDRLPMSSNPLDTLNQGFGGGEGQ